MQLIISLNRSNVQLSIAMECIVWNVCKNLQNVFRSIRKKEHFRMSQLDGKHILKKGIPFYIGLLSHFTNLNISDELVRIVTL